MTGWHHHEYSLWRLVTGHHWSWPTRKDGERQVSVRRSKGRSCVTLVVAVACVLAFGSTIAVSGVASAGTDGVAEPVASAGTDGVTEPVASAGTDEVLSAGRDAVDLATASAVTITSRGTASSATYRSDSTTNLTLPVPFGAQPGDVLIASLGFGSAGASSQPTLTVPVGWTLASRTNEGVVAALAVYSHVLVPGETSYTWKTSSPVGGVVFVAAYGGVNSTSPIDVSAGRTSGGRTTSIATPSVTTSVAGDVLVSSFFGYVGRKAKGSSWRPPTGMTEIGDASDGTNRSGSLDFVGPVTAGASGSKTATASVTQDYALATLTALRPAASTADTTPPVISAVAAASISSTGATVSWATDEASNSQVEFGLTTTYGSSTSLDGSATLSHSQVITGLAANATYHYRVRSRDGAGNLATSTDFTFLTASLPTGPVPLIVDTDIFSDADDAGALATAFALQIRGEAHVIAIGVNTRTSRPAVATNSWKCAAAVAQFYNAALTPIGTDMPNNGTETNTADFIGPCSTLASPTTPIPDSAVRVFRQALVGQADGSVVIAEAGYSGNLAALLNSPGDGISPLNGRDLLARKVKMLVIMAGGYPSRSGENNLIGNPAAAQDVANNWPTKIVWSGYEVGDAIRTGNTISRTHPVNSPVRVSYEAFVGPNNWIYSYDLTAIYYAVRPTDPLLTEVGPGKNTVTNTGGNTFTPGSGNQYYLNLSNATALDASIEALLGTLPPSQPGDTTPPVIGGIAVGSIGPTGVVVSWTTDEASNSQVEYGLTASYGSSTTLDVSATLAHSQPITGLAASTTYRYRVKSRDVAGNLATSTDLSFQTAAASGTGLNDTFDSNTIDPTKWIATPGGSTVTAINQQLEITHAAGAWTKGTIQSVTSYDQTGKAIQVQMKRAANNGIGGSTFGETSIFLWVDATHYVSFFVASGTLTTWVNSGSGEVNLTPNWPAYSPTNMQWLRFRESAGTLYWEYASGATSPGTWTVIASTADPFALNAVTLKIVAGSNVNANDTAMFDNVSTV